MRISKVILDKFKCVAHVEILLGGINVLVGGNNSGKSSVLQGIHFCAGAAAAARRLGQQTLPQDALAYVPARDFSYLRYGVPYSNQTHSGFLELFAKPSDDAAEISYKIRIYRGRNEGNIGCDRSGDTKLGAVVGDGENAFTIYVPGLAGVPTYEQLRSESVIRNGVASGDSNLYLRNVLYLINQYQKLPELVALVRRVFPSLEVAPVV